MVVLGVVLGGAASGALLAVGSLVPGIKPVGGGKGRLALWGMVAAAAGLILFEWTKVH